MAPRGRFGNDVVSQIFCCYWPNGMKVSLAQFTEQGAPKTVAANERVPLLRGLLLELFEYP